MSDPTTKPEFITLSDFGKLVELGTESRVVTFTLDDDDDKTPQKRICSVKIRPLGSEEIAAADRLSDKLPPRVPRETIGAMGKLERTEEFDYWSPAFLEEKRQGERLRRALILDCGLVDMKLEGKDIGEKAKFLDDSKLPPRVLDFLAGEIERISKGEVKILELANFTSNAG